MAKDLTPIDTEYKEKYFRSRTEARWAVFFDKMNWKWEYEIEGYKLPSGWYLPDFYLPELDMFAEVKPFEFTREELTKCKELSIAMNPEYGEPTVLLLDGSPDEKSYQTLSAGVFGLDVILMPFGDKYYPFYYGSSFDRKYFDETFKAVRYAKMARFEFEWKEK